MKLVREHINEIKQHMPTSGLGPIGVGKSFIYKGAAFVYNNYPEVAKQLYHMADYPTLSLPKEVKDKIVELMDNDESRIWVFKGWENSDQLEVHDHFESVIRYDNSLPTYRIRTSAVSGPIDYIIRFSPYLNAAVVWYSSGIVINYVYFINGG